MKHARGDEDGRGCDRDADEHDATDVHAAIVAAQVLRERVGFHELAKHTVASLSREQC